MPGRRKPSRSRIDAEDDDAVGVLVRGEKERPGRVDAEPARCPSPRRDVLDESKGALGLVDGEHRDGVVSAVRGVEEPTARMRQDLGSAEFVADGDAVLEPICVRIAIAVKLTGIPRSTLYELIGAGELETVKLGRSTIIRYASLKRLFERR